MSLCKDEFGNIKTGRDLRVTSNHDQINVALPRGLKNLLGYVTSFEEHVDRYGYRS